jgi:hypothetical protein
MAAGLLEGKTYPQQTIIPPENLTKDTYQKWLDDNFITPDAPF